MALGMVILKIRYDEEDTVMMLVTVMVVVMMVMMMVAVGMVKTVMVG